MRKRIKIVYVLEATGGGTRRHISQILLHLDLKKFEPILFCAVKREPAFMNDIELFKKRGIKVQIFPMKRAINPISDLCSLISMAQALRHEKPDIIHTHSSKAGVIGRIAAKWAGVPKIVHTPHVFPFEMAIGPLTKHFYLMLERITAKFTSLLIAVSKSEKAVAVEKGVFSKKNTIVNKNGIDPELWPPRDQKLRKMRGISESDFVVGMVGRFMPQKGYYVLVDAAGELLKQQTKIKFVLVGDGDLKETIKAVTADKGIEQHFFFLDETDNIASIYALFDCLVLPSLWEGCPYTILEAMAMGLPVIASSVGGVSEIVKDGVSGLSVPPANAVKLAEAIEKLSEDRKFAEKLGKKGRKRVLKKYLLSDSIKRLEKIYGKLIKEKR